MPSFLESNPGAKLAISAILNSLPGCRPLFNGQYREIIEDVAPTLSITHPTKFAQVADAFATGERRRQQFTDYMLTEHCGGVFIESFLPKHSIHPAISLMRRHASDELQHGKLFGQLAGTTVQAQSGSQSFAVETRYHSAYARWAGSDFFSLICLLHGFELRSAVLQCYWFALMDMFPESEAAAIRPVFSRIATDEVFHITYTGLLVVEGLADGESADTLAAAMRLAEAPIETLESL